MLRYWLATVVLLFASGLGIAAEESKGTIPIAAWDVVPYQIIDKPFKAGVVAFHETPVKATFKVIAEGNVKPLLEKTVEMPTLNDRVNVWEFWVELKPDEMPDGPIQLQATITPEKGRPIELKSLTLYSNGKGAVKPGKVVYADAEAGDDANDGTAEKPFKTLKTGVKAAGDGGTICLQPGVYSPKSLGGGQKRQYWTTITPAAGVTRDQVEISPGRPGTEKLCFKNVTLFSDPPKRSYNTILAGDNGSKIVWLDNCRLYNKKGRWGGGGNAFGNRYPAYVTGGLTEEMDNGPSAILMRDHQMRNMTSDIFTGARVAINSGVDGVDPGKTGAHPDFHQSYVGDRSKFNSVILYNCRGVNAKSQGFFGHNLKDSAFVNCLFVKVPKNPMYSQYSGKLEHVLFYHITTPNQAWLWRGNLKSKDCYFVNNLVGSMGIHSKEGADVSGITFENNHFLRPNSGLGENKTNGDAMFVDPEKGDYRLKSNSPAAGSGKPLQCVPADIGGKPRSAEKPGRGCFAAPSNESSTKK